MKRGSSCINHLRTIRSPFYLKAQVVPRCKHLLLRLYKPVVEGCIGKTSMFFSETRTKDINILGEECRIFVCYD